MQILVILQVNVYQNLLIHSSLFYVNKQTVEFDLSLKE